jgi:flagellar protein FliO/FliZ
LGGEKLKLSRLFNSVFFAVLFFVSIFFGNLFPLYSQTLSDEGQTSDTFQDTPGISTELSYGINESEIILDEASSPIAPNGGSSIFVMLRMVLVLALAALAIYGVVFFIKRLARPRESQDANLRILARLPIGSDAYAAVISVGSKAWLIAGGSGGANLISEINEPEALETMLIEDAQKTAAAGLRRVFNFRSLLRKHGDKAPYDKSSGDKAPDDKSSSDKAPGASRLAGGSFAETHSLVEGLREQRERLKGL